jgi:Zn-dependent M28 family amino/carboxypeptidase
MRSAVLGLLAALAALPARAYSDHPATTPAITAADLAARDKAIADDAFEGRGPGTRNGEAAADWIAEEMKRIGLRPGNAGSYFQQVPAVTITLDPARSSFSLATRDGTMTPKFPDDTVYWSPQFTGTAIKVAGAPLVFVGYGVVAPEYHWNDYAGVDVKGKTVVILINDPGNEDAAPDPDFFKGKAMTYYGRWTYKYEEAARQGAAAALIVHETGPAAYGWQVVRNSNSGAKSWLESPDKNAGMVPIEGWITLGTAKELFRRAGLDYPAEKAAANRPGFKAIPMQGEALSVDAQSTIAHMRTRNVVGVIPGSKHPDEYVLFTAHWDHLGIKPDAPGADKIFNGAIDNAMGVASVLELGEAFAHDLKPPERSIAIIDWTLEEQGLLGSAYFAEHPLWPLSHIVGGVNLDVILPEGPAHDMGLVGSGASELEDILGAILKAKDRVISPDPHPEQGGYFRSDHISLAKVGVPMIYPKSGFDLARGGRAAGQAVYDNYLQHFYHQPSDEFDPNWDLSGPVEDLKVLYAFGLALANSDQWPDWYKGNEFRAFRDQSRKNEP